MAIEIRLKCGCIATAGCDVDPHLIDFILACQSCTEVLHHLELEAEALRFQIVNQEYPQ